MPESLHLSSDELEGRSSLRDRRKTRPNEEVSNPRNVGEWRARKRRNVNSELATQAVFVLALYVASLGSMYWRMSMEIDRQRESCTESMTVLASSKDEELRMFKEHHVHKERELL
eukprot:CAMPEP_0177737804 /NCGR_PEP_ID=MMETSP0484_2-20121128/26089_1 /TAXON_ID=354590 /ORGANISM="Rhodomonas lens, Strain RHODO" /LENGTH=114 /DNA_ID=CAMNT_0019251627 /DNA_START=232 /DNA_END=573 /DNA_ORIENTATION=+